ncbi:helix-turn-helix domain-containing protein [Nocardioides humi]|uniref:Helix-turn-helix domain-containing protein n=1 Tax=Nocardioides humi TaxID=449461 RepID=A0ABN1ZUN0_9ACTN|nr:helix-turn-helix domain-containing protein [Nocardioides humi]
MATPLGDFLRARRDATPPATVGLPTTGRRRAPGLRRSELAALAGISVEYLTRIEQGRDRNPSVQVVTAIAEALRLDPSEREHLRNVTKVSAGQCLAGEPGRTQVRPSVRAILDQLEPGPAVVTNRFGDLLAYTSGYERLAVAVGLLDDPEPNLTRYVFTDERARSTFPDWDRVADQQALSIWTGIAGDRAAAFVEELGAAGGEEFTRRLSGVAVPRHGSLRWHHPDVGELRLDREVLELPADDAQQLVVLLPADEVTAAALDRLHRAASGSLRAVR